MLPILGTADAVQRVPELIENVKEGKTGKAIENVAGLGLDATAIGTGAVIGRNMFLNSTSNRLIGLRNQLAKTRKLNDYVRSLPKLVDKQGVHQTGAFKQPYIDKGQNRIVKTHISNNPDAKP